MLVLFETPAGYALFKVLNEGKLRETEDLWKEFQTEEKASKMVKLQKFQKFDNTTEALEATTALVESSMSSGLKKFLKKAVDTKDTLAVADSKLGTLISKKLDLKCVHDSSIMELMRGIRSQLPNLVSVDDADVNAMALGLSHSLSRYKLKFSPDKVDTMIVQAIALLDDLDKELNTYAMRVREWYGWHFPEMGKVVADNLMYARTVKAMGTRANASTADLSSILPEEIIKEVREVAAISMGTDVSQEDIENVTELCDQVISITEYREQLYEYLRNRMQAIAPNLTVMVGELVGARLVAHAGSLLSLAKYPASTIQILGAEKALFRALKTKHDTPKYGLIFHASLIGQTAPKNKGKISRVLAAKVALGVRVDALGDANTPNIGIDNRAKVELRARQLESGMTGRVSGMSKRGTGAFPKYDSTRNAQTPGLVRRTGHEGSAASTMGKPPAYGLKDEEGDVDMDKPESNGHKTPKKEDKKKKKDEEKEEAPKSSKKDKKKKAESDSEEEAPKSSKKDKKKKAESEEEAPKSAKKDKKKKKEEEEEEAPKSSKKDKKKKKADSDSEEEAPKSSKKDKKKRSRGSDSESEGSSKRDKKSKKEKK